MTPISLGIFASANQSAAATSFESIATVTVGAGGSSSIDFTSIPSTYTHLQLRVMFKASASNGGTPRLRFNSDSNANYAYHAVVGDGSATSAQAYQDQDGVFLGLGFQRTADFVVSVIDILDYGNTNKNKTVRFLQGFDANGSGVVGLFSGLWRSTSAISNITIVPQGGTGTWTQYSHFALYGIKSA